MLGFDGLLTELQILPDLTNAAMTALVMVSMDDVSVRSPLGTLMVVGASDIDCMAVRNSCWASKSSILADSLFHVPSSAC